MKTSIVRLASVSPYSTHTHASLLSSVVLAPGELRSLLPAAMGGIVTISYVTSWYTINICIVLLNKIVIKDHFQFPVTLTLFHQAFCFLMATVRRPQNAEPCPCILFRSMQQY